MKLEYIVEDELNIKKILKEKLSISERLYKKIKNDRIFLNSQSAVLYIPAEKGDIITIDLDFEETSDNIVPNEKVSFKILYEDDWMLIVEKPAGIPVHPSLNHYENSLSNGIKYYYNTHNIKKKIRPVNRLDKGTSGIVVFAKSEYIQDNMNSYTKEYLTIIEGKMNGSGTINKAIARKDGSIIERCIDEQKGEYAVTHYEVMKNLLIKNNDSEVINLSLIKCKLETGRTHQIRVHFASIGHPLLGDTLYGNHSTLINRQALHAYHISFIHPVTRKEINIVDSLPYEIINILQLSET